MQTSFKQYLGTKGITPTNEIEGQITFLSDGLFYIFAYDNSDPYYFRIILPNVFQIVDNKSEYDSLVNELNQRFKVAKTYIVSNNTIWIAAEQFICTHEGLELLFERCIALLKFVIDYFRERQSQLIHD